MIPLYGCLAPLSGHLTNQSKSIRVGSIAVNAIRRKWTNCDRVTSCCCVEVSKGQEPDTGKSPRLPAFENTMVRGMNSLGGVLFSMM